MKKIKHLLAFLLIIGFVVSMAGCYLISSQTMNKLKGTYKLTNYTYTPSYERKEGYTPKTYDYVNGEEYKFEDYLVITGQSMGYYIHKDAKGDCYVKEVTLKYEYDQEDSSKVSYIVYNDSITVNSDSDVNRMGVNKRILNYSKNAFDYTQLLTKKPMRSEDLSVRWEKVDDATDISYAISQVGNAKYYKYEAYAARGIYELSYVKNAATQEYLENPYQYYFISVDTADGTNTATVCYATKEAPTEQVKKTVSFSVSEDYGTLTVDGVVWTRDALVKTTLKSVADGFENQMNIASYDVTDKSLESLITNRMPVTEEQNG